MSSSAAATKDDGEASGTFLPHHATVQKILYSILKLEKNEDGTESFVELLEPSPTVDEAMATMGLDRDGSQSEDVKGKTLKVVIGKLDKVLMGLDVEAREDGRLEEKLKEFEKVVEMPEEGRGGLFGLLSQPGVKVEAIVMFLSNYYDAAAAETVVVPEEGDAAAAVVREEGDAAAATESGEGSADGN